ncbi:hypothetical protein [Symbiobacterium thermophilum]|jgi:hypothetical protein|nr:hypothetical protein [Symbiobacterium thermophilum]MBY6275074.1 hypothetical protein [Symbiobacterium thermophilum]
MMFGFAPVWPAAAPLFAAPVINVWWYELKNVSSGGVVSTGVLDLGFLTSNSKGNSLTDQGGDATYSATWYGFLSDTDWVDTPYANMAGFQVGG